MCLVKRRHIHARQLRKLSQALRLAASGVDNVQNTLHRILALADDEGIGYGGQGLWVKGCAGPANDYQGLALVALRRPQLDIAQIQHRQQIVIIHFKGKHHKKYRKIR